MMKKKATFFAFLFLIGLSLVLFSYSRAQEAPKKTGVLESISISKEADRLDVKIIFNVFTIRRQLELTNPNRLVIDFVNLEKINAAASYKVDYLGVRSIRTGMFKPNIARVVFDIAGEIPSYSIESIENGVDITFGVKEAPKEAPKVPAVVEEVKEIKVEDAICGLKVVPEKANINDAISVDMAGSQHAQSMELEVFNPEGTKIDTKKLTPDSAQWKTTFGKPGEYAFKGKAFNTQGKPSENPCQAKVYINFPPICKLQCKPTQEYAKKPIAFDASGSMDNDGQVVKVEFIVSDEAGNVIDRHTDSEKPFAWQKSFEKEGLYTITALATDDFGGLSEPARVSVMINPKKPRKALFLADAGALAARGAGTYIGYPVLRVGLVYRTAIRKLDFVLGGGGGYISKLPGWKSFYIVDALLNYHFGPVFIGAGGSVTSKFREISSHSYGEVVANLGFNIFRKVNFSGSIFFEGRGPANGLSFKDNYRMMLGFRFLL
jgi:hypothetical protein